MNAASALAAVALSLLWFVLGYAACHRRTVTAVRSMRDERNDLLAQSGSLQAFQDDAKMWFWAKARPSIELTDWGPDFTGENDTLHRWRWVVTDDYTDIRKMLGIPEDKNRPHVLMLGNAPTAEQAWQSAYRWTQKTVDETPEAYAWRA